jgi:hypothetical protein
MRSRPTETLFSGARQMLPPPLGIASSAPASRTELPPRLWPFAAQPGTDTGAPVRGGSNFADPTVVAWAGRLGIAGEAR